MMKNYEVKYENMTNITAVLSKDDFRTFTEKVDIASSKGVDIPHIVEYDTVLDTYEVILLDNSKTMEELDRITS
jgi:hypothetical protein|tara:strand:- start:312 stop:533 length:222 start_codon:yes stop_codon:yes gene_type:complete